MAMRIQENSKFSVKITSFPQVWSDDRLILSLENSYGPNCDTNVYPNNSWIAVILSFIGYAFIAGVIGVALGKF
jgi:hypothetical protein